jgi:hypothetical protein
MEPRERQRVLHQLASSESHVLHLLDGLTPAQWSFHESPERWSIAENVEHLIVFEDFIRQAVKNALAAKADPGRSAVVAEKESLVFNIASRRGARLKAREATQPTGRWTGAAELIPHLRATRARTVAFASETDADLRAHFFAHIAFGDLDCYQWLLLLGRHSLRHTLQIEEIKARPAYPTS